MSPDQKAGRLAFCDTKCVSGETDGEFTGAGGFGAWEDLQKKNRQVKGGAGSMGMDVLEVKTPGELVMWLAMTESEISMNQSEAEIILDYLHEHEFSLAVHKQELMVRNTADEFSEYQLYSIDNAIHDVCEWNLELIDNMEDGMKNPDSQEEYLRFSEAHDVLKEQEKVLDGLWQQTEYEQMAKDIALQVITATLGSVPEGLAEKIQAYGTKGADQPEDGRQADGRGEQERMR